MVTKAVVPTNRRIGYARVDTKAAQGDLSRWVAALRQAGACEVHTDIGPLPTALTGLKRAVSRLTAGDSLIYPAPCLSELTIGDTPDVFAGLPDGAELAYFEPVDPMGAAKNISFQTIRLCASCFQP